MRWDEVCKEKKEEGREDGRGRPEERCVDDAVSPPFNELQLAALDLREADLCDSWWTAWRAAAGQREIIFHSKQYTSRLTPP